MGVLSAGRDGCMCKGCGMSTLKGWGMCGCMYKRRGWVYTHRVGVGQRLRVSVGVCSKGVGGRMHREPLNWEILHPSITSSTRGLMSLLLSLPPG